METNCTYIVVAVAERDCGRCDYWFDRVWAMVAVPTAEDAEREKQKVLAWWRDVAEPVHRDRSRVTFRDAVAESATAHGWSIPPTEDQYRNWSDCAGMRFAVWPVPVREPSSRAGGTVDMAAGPGGVRKGEFLVHIDPGSFRLLENGEWAATVIPAPVDMPDPAFDDA